MAADAANTIQETPTTPSAPSFLAITIRTYKPLFVSEPLDFHGGFGGEVEFVAIGADVLSATVVAESVHADAEVGGRVETPVEMRVAFVVVHDFGEFEFNPSHESIGYDICVAEIVCPVGMDHRSADTRVGADIGKKADLCIAVRGVGGELDRLDDLERLFGDRDEVDAAEGEWSVVVDEHGVWKIHDETVRAIDSHCGGFD